MYTSQGTCWCWAYISICSHAWLEECGWSWAGLTTDPHKLVLSTTGENWALEILSNDHIKNYFKMLHQALLLMDILEIVFCLSNRYHSSISYEQQRLSAWMAVAAYLLEKCLCKKFYCVKSSNQPCSTANGSGHDQHLLTMAKFLKFSLFCRYQGSLPRGLNRLNWAFAIIMIFYPRYIAQHQYLDLWRRGVTRLE